MAGELRTTLYAAPILMRFFYFRLALGSPVYMCWCSIMTVLRTQGEREPGPYTLDGFLDTPGSRCTSNVAHADKCRAAICVMCSAAAPVSI